MAKNKQRLTPKQRSFCDYYIEKGHGTEAAILAGYSKKSARAKASQMLAMPHIREYIDERMAEKDKELIASQDEVLSFLTKVMRGDEIEKIPLGLGMGEQRLVENGAQLKDRIRAGELIGKRYGMWKETKDINGEVAINFIEDLDE